MHAYQAQQSIKGGESSYLWSEAGIDCKDTGPKVSQRGLQTWEKKLLLPQRTTEISCRHTGCSLGMD